MSDAGEVSEESQTANHTNAQENTMRLLHKFTLKLIGSLKPTTEKTDFLIS